MRARRASSVGLVAVVGCIAAATVIPAAAQALPAAVEPTAQPVGETRMVSVANDGEQLLRNSTSPAVSADGRYVAFTSRGRVVEGRLSPYDQVYVRDQRTGVSVLVSAARRGGPGGGPSSFPTISADGTRVAYQSAAPNLVRRDDNGVADVFLYDTATGKTTLMSRAADGGQTTGGSNSPALSADGTHVAFGSSDSTIVPGSGDFPKVFLHDVAAGTTVLVSRTVSGAEATAPSYSSSVSGDGRLVTYWSSVTDLVPDDDNGVDDVFLYDAEADTNTLISRNPEGEPANQSSVTSMISADGSQVAYYSAASDLVPGDTNFFADVFRYEVATGTTTLISAGRRGRPSDGDSYYPSISADGRMIAYSSWATNLVPDDEYFSTDVFVYDADEGTTRLISRARNGSGADGSSDRAKVSLDGSHVAFESAAGNLVLGDSDGEQRRYDVFLHRLS